MKLQITGLKLVNVEETITNLENWEQGDLLAYGASLEEVSPNSPKTAKAAAEMYQLIKVIAGCLATECSHGLVLNGVFYFADCGDSLMSELDNTPDEDKENHLYVILTN